MRVHDVTVRPATVQLQPMMMLLAIAIAFATIGPTVAYDVGAIYFGDWHVNEDMAAVHGPGWTEWELVVNAKPRYANHSQPNLPLETPGCVCEMCDVIDFSLYSVCVCLSACLFDFFCLSL